ncbi:hypothetical protein [Halosimplex marinum]|uniref:hypothetical protein n=1 Tax=Halosimplex marinum TaxID=3396620 RepID=UPI003F557BFF
MGGTPRNFVILDSTVISNFAYTDSLDVVCEAFPEVRATDPVINEVERGVDDGHEFLQNALEYLPEAGYISSSENPTIPRVDSISEHDYRSRSFRGIELSTRLISEEYETEYDWESVLELVQDCLDEIECGEASAILTGYITDRPVATDDQDARELARRYSVSVTDSLGVLARCVSEECISVETANEWLDMWVEENEYYSPVEDIRELDGI